MSVLDGLIDKSHMFHFREKHYYLFSKSGYTDNCIRNSVSNVKLIEFKSMT